jgi:hypothetical protein
VLGIAEWKNFFEQRGFTRVNAKFCDIFGGSDVMLAPKRRASLRKGSKPHGKNVSGEGTQFNSWGMVAESSMGP